MWVRDIDILDSHERSSYVFIYYSATAYDRNNTMHVISLYFTAENH